jgi:hypothetical protein
MIELDVADLVVIAGQTLGIGTSVALSQLDAAAAEAALAEARLAGHEAASAAAGPRRPGGRPARPHRGAAAAAAIGLVHALLRHPPFPSHGEQVAVAAGLQFLAVNGWQADLDVPQAAVIIVEGLATGQLTPADAAAWLAPRLSPHPASPASQAPRQPPLPRLKSRVRKTLRAAGVSPRRKAGRRGPAPFIIAVGGQGGRGGQGKAGIRTPATGFMPFTGPALDSVLLAGQEARRHGHDRPDCCDEHILVGLIGEGHGVAVKALQRLGISTETVRQQAGQITGLRGQQARRVWHAAVDEAVPHGHDYIGTEHLLLALYCDSDGTPAQALARLGAGESEVRGAITALLAESERERSA